MQTVIIRSYRFIRTFDEDDFSEAERRAVVLTPEEARQGVVSGRILAVLKLSLSLAVMAGAMLVVLHVFPI